MKTRTLLLAGVAALSMATSAHAAYDQCAIVLKTPDGFLAMREKPTTRSKITRKLHRGDVLVLNKSTLRWTKKAEQWILASVKGIASNEFPDADLEWEDGFVSRKYILQFRCSDAESGNPHAEPGGYTPPSLYQGKPEDYRVPGVLIPEDLKGTAPGG